MTAATKPSAAAEYSANDAPKQPAKPTSAAAVLEQVDEDHNWDHAPIDTSTTGGVQALAAYIDGR